MTKNNTDTVIIPPDLPVYRLSERPVEVGTENKENAVRVDWLAFTFPEEILTNCTTNTGVWDTLAGLTVPKDELARLNHVDDQGRVAQLLDDLLGLPVTNWRHIGHGGLGYQHCLELDGCSGARVYFGGESQKGTIHVSLSAQALAFYVDVRGLDWAGWLRYLRDVRVIFRRFDVAFDDFNDAVTFGRIANALSSGALVTRFRNQPMLQGVYPFVEDGWTFYWGVARKKRGRHANSESVIRIYDKAAEQERKDITWVRVECQFTGEKCHAIVTQWLEQECSTAYLIGVLRGVLDFRTPTDDTNRSRWPVADWWCDFLGSTETVRVCVHARLRTVRDMVEWLRAQVATSLAVVNEVFGRETINELIDHGAENLTTRHRRIMETEAALGAFAG